MAQNVIIAGDSYPDVPSVELNKVGGGVATFIDTSDANATAPDILSGKTAYVNGSKITGTGSGGGLTPIGTTTTSKFIAPLQVGNFVEMNIFGTASGNYADTICTGNPCSISIDGTYVYTFSIYSNGLRCIRTAYDSNGWNGSSPNSVKNVSLSTSYSVYNTSLTSYVSHLGEYSSKHYFLFSMRGNGKGLTAIVGIVESANDFTLSIESETTNTYSVNSSTGGFGCNLFKMGNSWIFMHVATSSNYTDYFYHTIEIPSESTSLSVTVISGSSLWTASSGLSAVNLNGNFSVNMLTPTKYFIVVTNGYRKNSSPYGYYQLSYIVNISNNTVSATEYPLFLDTYTYLIQSFCQIHVSLQSDGYYHLTCLSSQQRITANIQYTPSPENISIGTSTITNFSTLLGFSYVYSESSQSYNVFSNEILYDAAVVDLNGANKELVSHWSLTGELLYYTMVSNSDRLTNTTIPKYNNNYIVTTEGMLAGGALTKYNSSTSSARCKYYIFYDTNHVITKAKVASNFCVGICTDILGDTATIVTY